MEQRFDEAPRAQGCEPVSEAVRMFHRGRANDHAVCARIEQCACGVNGTDTAADLYWDADCLEHAFDHLRVGALAAARAIEIDHVQPFGAFVLPVPSHRHGIVAIDGLLAKVTLAQAHATPAADVNRRYGDECHPEASLRLSSSEAKEAEGSRSRSFAALRRDPSLRSG